MAMKTVHEVSLWVKAEPFTYASIPVAPHPRLSSSNIKRILTYAKTKGPEGFPSLSYTVWRHIAVNKMQLTEDLAWMYFKIYDLFMQRSSEEKLSIDKLLTSCKSISERNSQKEMFFVHTYTFVLFLYIQQMHKISLRNSFNASTEAWPTRPRSPPDSTRTSSQSSKALDEQSHFLFVQQHLNDILELLVEPDSVGANANDKRLSVDAVKSLSYIFMGSLNRDNISSSFHTIALSPQIQGISGYSKLTQSFSLRSLQFWISKSLAIGPYSISSLLNKGRLLNWIIPKQTEKSEKFKGRIMSNANIVPDCQMEGNKAILITHVNGKTIARSSTTLEYSTVKIHRCNHSQFYLLSPLRSTTIVKCRNSTIILGVVDTVVHVDKCERIKLIVACRNLMVSSSSNCTIHLMTTTRPLILSSNENITLAPYHTYYPTLDRHLLQVGLHTNQRMWNQPLCVGPDHDPDRQPVWNVLPPKEFNLFKIPFIFENVQEPITNGLPSPLPPEYAKAYEEMQASVASWKRKVRDMGLENTERREYQDFVQQSFQLWLSERGLQTQLDQLSVNE